MRGRIAAFAIGRSAGKNAVQQQSGPSQESSTQVSELQELVRLHDEGALTDKEFSSAKKKLLSGK